MSYPNRNFPNMWGRENPEQYAGYYDTVTGRTIGDLAEHGYYGSPFGWVPTDSGIALPNYPLMDAYRQAALSQQQQTNNYSKYNSEEYQRSVINACGAAYLEDLRRQNEYAVKADQFFRKGNYVLAEHYYNQAIYPDPTPEVLTNKSSALVGLKRWPQALMAADTVIESYPTYPRGYIAYNNKAIALAAIGQREDALAQYVNHAIPNDPKSAVSRNNAGALLITMYRYNEALSLFRQAEQRGGPSLEVYNNAGVALTYVGRLQEAMDVLNHAQQLSPDNGIVIINKVAIYILQKQIPVALRWLNRILELDSDNQIVQSALRADALVNQRQYAEALSLYGRLATTYPAHRGVFDYKIRATNSLKDQDVQKNNSVRLSQSSASLRRSNRNSVRLGQLSASRRRYKQAIGEPASRLMNMLAIVDTVRI